MRTLCTSTTLLVWKLEMEVSDLKQLLWELASAHVCWLSKVINDVLTFSAVDHQAPAIAYSVAANCCSTCHACAGTHGTLSFACILVHASLCTLWVCSSPYTTPCNPHYFDSKPCHYGLINDQLLLLRVCCSPYKLPVLQHWTA